MRIRQVDPRKIGVPDVRVTSAMEPEEYEELKASIAAQGILNPILVRETPEGLVLADGLHRLRVALDLKLEKVPAVVEPGTVRDTLIGNLITAKMRGRTKPSDLVAVVAELREAMAMDTAAIEEVTGLSRGYVTDLLHVAEAGEDLRAMVDRGEISVTRAAVVARIADPEAQAFVATQALALRMPTEDIRRFVNLVLEEKAKPATEQKPVQEIAPPRAHCKTCGQEDYPWNLRADPICDTCFALLHEAVRAASRVPAPQGTP